MGKIVSIVSGKGGTGKTTATAAIASCMATMGKKVLCIDCDVGLRNLDIVLGLSDTLLPNFTSLTDTEDNVSKIAFEDVCYEHPAINGLFLLAAPPTYSTDLDYDSLKNAIFNLKKRFDFIIIDAPAGISTFFRFASMLADMAIIVTTCDAGGIRDAEITCSELNKIGVTDIKLIVNKVNTSLLKKSEFTLDTVIDRVGAQLIGYVNEDNDVKVSANCEIPLVFYSRGSAAHGFLRIARRLCGENIPLSK